MPIEQYRRIERLLQLVLQLIEVLAKPLAFFCGNAFQPFSL